MFDNTWIVWLSEYTGYLVLPLGLIIIMGSTLSWSLTAQNYYLTDEEIKDFELEGGIIGAVFWLISILILYTIWLGSNPFIILN